MAASRARVLAERRADPSDPPPPRLGTITGLICWSNWSSTKPSTGILLSQILSRRTPLWHSGELGRIIYVLCTDVCVRTMMPILTLIVVLNHSLIFNPFKQGETPTLSVQAKKRKRSLDFIRWERTSAPRGGICFWFSRGSVGREIQSANPIPGNPRPRASSNKVPS